MPRLFVYGSLRKGQPAHHFLGESPLWLATLTLYGFRMYSNHSYPFVIRGLPTEQVVGEIYEIEPAVLEQVDRYEDVPLLYQRVWLPDYQCFIYLKSNHIIEILPIIAHGDWVRFLKDEK